MTLVGTSHILLSVDLCIYCYYLGVPFVTQLIKNLPAIQETQVPSLGWEDPLEKGKATHSSILAWRSLVTKSQTRLSNFHFSAAGSVVHLGVS